MAIAFDAATSGETTSGTSLTYSHSCSGADRLLFVGVVGDYTTDDVSGVTYGGVAMTLIGKINGVSNLGRYTYLYYLIAPASGANNVVVSASSSHFLASLAASYTGAKQSAQPDAFVTDNTYSSPSTVTVTTVADNCWTVMVAHDDGQNATASTGSTYRIQDTTFTGLIAMFDSNGPKTPAGSTSMTYTYSGIPAAVMASFAPAGAAGTAAISGTGGGGMTEAEVVAGGKTIIITLGGGETWIPS